MFVFTLLWEVSLIQNNRNVTLTINLKTYMTKEALSIIKLFSKSISTALFSQYLCLFSLFQMIKRVEYQIDHFHGMSLRTDVLSSYVSCWFRLGFTLSHVIITDSKSAESLYFTGVVSHFSEPKSVKTNSQNCCTRCILHLSQYADPFPLALIIPVNKH